MAPSFDTSAVEASAADAPDAGAGAPAEALAPTIILWAVPRSVSTAFERTFAARGDCRVVHEPFTRSYYFSRRRRSARYGDQPHLAAHDGHEEIGDAARQGGGSAVFVKELAFQAAPYASDALLRRARHSFIIRHPFNVLASLLPLKPDASEDEFGFGPLMEIWERVAALSPGQAPPVVDGDRFRRDPAGTLERYCERLGLSFEQGCLSWRTGRLRTWNADEAESQAKWHATLEGSTGILPPGETPRAEIPEAWRPAYDRALAVYEKLAAHAI
ncbi:hypothetical protein [Arenibaculum sp.]|uniref:sulfotransferase-like domain-containing protein n=1 Tax=Arenibaculum sp. TaxID=2865862 RepID=UPI002E13CB0C|nr:hypothetical protein [Arenibaculum sp.]